jgi:hypothetical protein
VCSEALLELIDYCFRKVTLMNIGRFNAFIDDSAAVDLLKETAEQTLQRQACEVGFRTAVSAFDVLRFVTDHLKRMPLSAQVRHPIILLPAAANAFYANIIRNPVEFVIVSETRHILRLISNHSCCDALFLSCLCALSLPPLPRCSLQTRLLNTNDTLMAVVSLVESQFWMRRNDRIGALQKYVDSAWRTVAASDRAALCKTEVCA